MKKTALLFVLAVGAAAPARAEMPECPCPDFAYSQYTDNNNVVFLRITTHSKAVLQGHVDCWSKTSFGQDFQKGGAVAFAVNDPAPNPGQNYGDMGVCSANDYRYEMDVQLRRADGSYCRCIEQPQ